MLIDTAVIISNQRNSESSQSKWNSRSKILGLPMLKRTILTANQAGVKNFILISNKEDKIISSLKKDTILKEKGIKLQFLFLSDLLHNKYPEIKKDFWLLNSTLTFDPKILINTTHLKSENNKNLLLANSKQNLSEERVDSIRIKSNLKTKKVKVINGDIDEYNALYSGISLCAPRTFQELANLLKKSQTASLSTDIMNTLFTSTDFEVLEIGQNFCINITSKNTFKKAEKYLLNTARKPTDGFISRNFNRYISLFLTKRLIKLKLAPIHISIANLIIGLASGWFIGKGGYVNTLIATILFQFASMFDGCDGENARLTFRSSGLGANIDTVCDITTFLVFLVNLPIGLYGFTGKAIYIILGIVTIISVFSFYLIMANFVKKAKIRGHLVKIVKSIEQGSNSSGVIGKIDRLVSKSAFIYRRDFFSFSFLVFGILGGISIAMWITAILAPLEAIYFNFYSNRRLKQVTTK